METDTGHWWSLVESDAQIGSPSWSPGSDWIAFSMKRNNQRDVVHH